MQTEEENKVSPFVQAGMGAPVAVLLGCIAVAAGVISDSDVWQGIGAFLVLGGFVVMAGAIVFTLIRRQWLLAIGGLGGILVSLVIAFLTVILIGAGQHHPPREQVEAADTVDVVVFDTEQEAVLLDNRLEKGSWWTNGERYFQVKTTGASYRLEGMTLHEGGLEALLETGGDSLDLRVAKPRDGMNSFAAVGCKVLHYSCMLSGADSATVELLVAYDRENGETPVAVLQRFDGDELKYELAGVHALLEGTFTDGKTAWTLLPNGTIQLTAGDKAKPYTVERFYHALTNVVRLPDGRHVALQLTDHDELLVLAAAYDSDEEQWGEATPRKELMRLPRKDQSVRRDMEVLDEVCLVTPAMLAFMDGDINDVVNRYCSIERSASPISRLNRALLLHWQYVQNNDIEE